MPPCDGVGSPHCEVGDVGAGCGVDEEVEVVFFPVGLYEGDAMLLAPLADVHDCVLPHLAVEYFLVVLGDEYDVVLKY